MYTIYITITIFACQRPTFSAIMHLKDKEPGDRDSLASNDVGAPESCYGDISNDDRTYPIEIKCDPLRDELDRVFFD
jgi:hypothetical protein